MYPRNAASPERIAIGAVVQISDGAVQTSGVSIKVKPQGTTASAGGGTTSYEEGIVEYLPTQAETNYTSFEVIAYKTGCIPVATTIVTTASATPGTVLLAPVTHTSAVVPTVTTLTGHTAQTGDAYARLGAPAGASVSADVAAVKTQTAAIEVDTQDIQGRLPAALVSGRMDASVGAMASGVLTATAIASDAITAAKVATDAVTEIQSGLATAANLATVAGYLDTEIAAILADTNELQTDWANGGRLDLILDARASQTSVDTIDGIVDDILVDTAAMPTAAGIADAVWDEILSGHAGVGSTGAALAAAGGSGDPWSTALPGAYGAGTAGQIVGDYIDAAISGVSGLDAAGVRAAVGLASANLDTQLSTIDTVADAILVDTAEIGAAGAGLTALASATNLATVAGYLDTEIAAILADTNELQTDWANGGRLDLILDARASQTSVDDLPTNAELATALGAADDATLAAIAALSIPTVGDIADAVHDEVVEGTTTLRQSIRLANAALGGKASGLETTAVAYRDLADTKDRITATVDADGNRSVVTRDLT